MKVDGIARRSLWRQGDVFAIIDQTRLPHEFVVREIATLDQAAAAIRSMQVRGAPLIGAAAAYGFAKLTGLPALTNSMILVSGVLPSL